MDCTFGSNLKPVDSVAVQSAVEKIQLATEFGPDPADQALSAFNNEIFDYMRRNDGKACINDLDRFETTVLKDLGTEIPKAMAMAWLSRGEAVHSTNGMNARIGGDVQEVRESELDAYLKASKGSGFLGYNLGTIIKNNFDSMGTTRGGINVMGTNFLGESSISKQTLESQLAQINVKLQLRLRAKDD